LLTEKDAELVEKAKEILKKHRQEFQEYYGVDQIGVGYKITGGKVSDKVALIFYVKNKKKKDGLSSYNIPEEIEGIPTDVVAIPEGFHPR
jgi:hypothetical protein